MIVHGTSVTPSSPTHSSGATTLPVQALRAPYRLEPLTITTDRLGASYRMCDLGSLP